MSEVYSPNCVEGHCETPQRLGGWVCAQLREIGVGQCGGRPIAGYLKGEPVLTGCLLPERVAQFIDAAHERGVTDHSRGAPKVHPAYIPPPSMVATVAEGVAQNHLRPYVIPAPRPNTAEGAVEAIEAWGAAVCVVEIGNHPDGPIIDPAQTQPQPLPRAPEQQP